MEQLIQMLQHPSPEARGWTRWWWYGCAVKRDEIDRELRFMQEAGLGGAEIQVLYPVAADDPEKGIRNLPYFSPEFFEILQFTVERAHALGLGIDFTLGSSWPYGGPFIPQDMAVQSALPYQIDVTGPVSGYCYDFTTRIAGTIEKVIMGKMQNSRMIERTIVDLSDHLADKQLYGWPWGKLLKDVEIPAGDWKIVAFVIGQYHQQVSIPARDAQGNVMDHCRRDVSDFFFQSAGKPLTDQLGEGAIRCFFCDSIELAGGNWTSVLLDEFKRRRGYDLGRYLYALWGEIDGISDRIRYDYYVTMSELTIENFFENLTCWCHAHGAKSRIQAHGTWGDLLRAYASADVPEGETFGPQDKLEVNSVHRRFASSAAHLYQRPVVSCETFTWLRSPRFLETLENMKAAVDAVFLDGINAVCNHGYAYSPPEAGKPGWPFFASSQINHTSPYWPCYRNLGDYIQRVSWLLRQGTAVCNVAVYLPQADVWSDNPMSDMHLGMKLQEHLGWGVTDRINKSGYYFDYINDEALNAFGAFGNGLTIHENTYRILVLIGCRRLPPETAESIEQFAQSGGILIAAEQAPSKSCGFVQHEARDAAVKTCMERVFPRERDVWRRCGHGWAAVASDRGDCLLAMLAQRCRPDVRITGGGDCVGYVHRRIGSSELFFLSNISEVSRVITADFSVCGKNLCVYDAMTARPCPIRACSEQEHGTRLELELEPFGSVFAFFGEAAGQLVLEQAHAAPPERFPISGPWTLRIPEADFACVQQQPACWQQYEPVRYFSGTGSYSVRFHLPRNDWKQAFLRLDSLHDTAEIRLNGQSCGRIWKRPLRLEVTGQVRAGENELEVRCTNKLINYALDPRNEPPLYPGETIRGWPYFSAVINQIRIRRIGYGKERAAVPAPMDSGLSGAVWLELSR